MMNSTVQPPPINDPAQFDRLPEETREELARWIYFAFLPARCECAATSYGLKHRFEAETGIYVTNGAFKGAMLREGYPPTDAEAKNWRFRVRVLRRAYCGR